MAENNFSILIVDDEPTVRNILKEILSSEGHRCLTAEDGAQGKEQLKTFNFDLLVTDILMPRMDGMQLMHEAKIINPDMPVIAISGLNDLETIRASIRTGIYDYIVKPFLATDVIDTTKRALEHRKLLLQLRDYKENLERKVEAQAKKIRAMSIDAISSMVLALEAKDTYTRGHSQIVTEISIHLGSTIGLESDILEKLEIAAKLHDIGKIGVHESVLHKPGPLTHEEFEHIKLHPTLGERIMRPIIKDEIILRAIRHHHEWYNGAGYPDKLQGDEIPFLARMLAIGDTFHAMISDRPYRKGLSKDKALLEIEKMAGEQLDPELTPKFLAFQREEAFKLKT